MVVQRINKILMNMDTLVFIGIKRAMITPDLLYLGVLRNIRVGSCRLEMVAMDMVTAVI